MDVPAGSVIAPILLDAPQNIEAALSVRFERLPEEVLVAGPATGTAVEYPQGDGTSNYQAAPLLLPGDLPPGDYSATFTHAALAKPIRVPYRVVGVAPSVVTFSAVMAAVETMMRPRLRVSTFETGGVAAGGAGAQVDHFTADTRPTLATATEAVARHTGEASVDYGGAEQEDAPAIVTVAALRAAIELESTHYPEQARPENYSVRIWMDLLDRYEKRLDGRESVADVGEDGGGPGLDPVWYFSPPLGYGQHIAEGAEAPLLPVIRPLRPRRVW